MAIPDTLETLARIDAQQDQVLRELDELNERILGVIREFSQAPEEPVVDQPQTSATEQEIPAQPAAETIAQPKAA